MYWIASVWLKKFQPDFLGTDALFLLRRIVKQGKGCYNVIKEKISGAKGKEKLAEGGVKISVTIFEHPLIKHKITLLRDINTGTRDFRTLIEEIATLMGYEALRDLPLEYVELDTPICRTVQPVVSGKKLAIVPILRAGLGMVNGILALVPSARVGHIGLYRDEVTHEPCEYYCKLPENLEKRTIIVLDPMLATGGSAVDAVNLIKKRGGSSIKFMSIIAAPKGLKRLSEAHPDIMIYCGHLDEGLNENCYIVPGLGDAGDRIFGTK